MAEKFYYGTGRRKTSTARVRIKPGKGIIRVNGRAFEEYFPRESLRLVINQAWDVTGTGNKFDVYATCVGGGLAGQAGALRHGLSRALLNYSPELRAVLKKATFLTRDSRSKERKKYGLRGARRGTQFSKR